jgi:hypothetical protein
MDNRPSSAGFIMLLIPRLRLSCLCSYHRVMQYAEPLRGYSASTSIVGLRTALCGPITMHQYMRKKPTCQDVV